MKNTRLNLGNIKIENDGCVNYEYRVKYYMIARIIHPITRMTSEVEGEFSIHSDPETDPSHKDTYLKAVADFAKETRDNLELFNLYNIKYNL